MKKNERVSCRYVMVRTPILASDTHCSEPFSEPYNPCNGLEGSCCNTFSQILKDDKGKPLRCKACLQGETQSLFTR